MWRWVLAGALSAALLVVPSAASAPLGYGALWACRAPCTIGYQIDGSFPDAEKQRIRAQAAAWSAAPEIDLVEKPGGKIHLESCESMSRERNCGFITYTDLSVGGDKFDIRRVEIVIDVRTFAGWEGLDFVYCHELAHALGFDDGEPSTPTVCPTADHWALLSVMYPLG